MCNTGLDKSAFSTYYFVKLFFHLRVCFLSVLSFQFDIFSVELKRNHSFYNTIWLSVILQYKIQF